MTFTLRMSSTIGKLMEAMALAQLEMDPAIKDSQNPHFRNNFASLASCMRSMKPLHKNGIAVMQPPQVAPPGRVRVITFVGHSSGEWMCGELEMPVTKNDAQGSGSALSYARRYCLQSTIGLATDDDDGEASIDRDPAKVPATLENKLDQSVRWADWEKSQHDALKACAAPGDLLETWSRIAAEGRGSPNGTLKRLGETKDKLKKSLQALQASTQ